MGQAVAGHRRHKPVPRHRTSWDARLYLNYQTRPITNHRVLQMVVDWERRGRSALAAAESNPPAS